MKLSISITQSLPTQSVATQSRPTGVNTTQSLPTRVDTIPAGTLPADTPPTATEQSAAMLPPTAIEQSVDTPPNTAQLYGYVRVSTREQNEARQIMPATVLPENATDRSVVWSSSNTSVATVEDSIVYAIAPGTAVIKATAASDSSK